AVGGRRDEYRPIVSKLTTSTDPVEVAKALLETTGAGELYVADLDAITGGLAVSPAVLRLLEELDGAIWLDVGISESQPASVLPDSPQAWPVVGTETATPADLTEVIRAVGSRPVAVSLDLKGERLLGKWEAWGAEHERGVSSVARTAIKAGAKTLIVL